MKFQVGDYIKATSKEYKNVVEIVKVVEQKGEDYEIEILFSENGYEGSHYSALKQTHWNLEKITKEEAMVELL